MRPVKRTKYNKGQGTVEFLIQLPIFLAFIFFMITIAVVWLSFYLNEQAANEGVAAQGAYGGGAAKAQMVTRFGSRLGTGTSSYSGGVADTVGEMIVMDTNSTIRPPWGMPLLMPFSLQSRGVSMSPKWEFAPEAAH